jgi:hypothetical protein
MEMHDCNSQSRVQFNARLFSFFTGTPGTYETVVIVYERAALNQPIAARNVRFGTAEIRPVHAAAWIYVAQAALTDVAPGAVVLPLVGVWPPCTAATGGAAPYASTSCASPIVHHRTHLTQATVIGFPSDVHIDRRLVNIDRRLVKRLDRDGGE